MIVNIKSMWCIYSMIAEYIGLDWSHSNPQPTFPPLNLILFLLPPFCMS